jgi:hypothetical protein
VTLTATNLGDDTTPIRGGWRVRRDDGTTRTVLPRLDTGWAVFDGQSTVDARTPALGFAGSRRQQPEAAIEWARTAVEAS